MLSIKKLSFAALLAVGAAAPSVAFADHYRGASTPDLGWIQLGDVGTHVHDADDYVPVAPGTRLDRLELRARDGAVALDGVRVQFADGHIEDAPIRERLLPGQSVDVDVPDRGEPVKMLILDYANRGPYWRALETAHVQVLGLASDAGRDRRALYDRTGGGLDRGERHVRHREPRATGGLQVRGSVGFRLR
ncbi:MAG TPA: hypothetical protein VHE35_00865 [Kofleriaceae bacterium]|nr:hypothetical protein [Kofleriaceae bacterium]